jgi:hypothetical protein
MLTLPPFTPLPVPPGPSATSALTVERLAAAGCCLAFPP